MYENLYIYRIFTYTHWLIHCFCVVTKSLQLRLYICKYIINKMLDYMDTLQYMKI